MTERRQNRLLRDLIERAGLTQTRFGSEAEIEKTHLRRLLNGTIPWPQLATRQRIRRVLAERGVDVADDEELGFRRPPTARTDQETGPPERVALTTDTPWLTAELVRRLQLSDVGTSTLELMHVTTDRLCTDYSYRPAADVRGEAQQWLRHVTGLLHQRVGLRQHRELLVIAGWLALLVACLEYDSGMDAAAESTRVAAGRLGQEAQHPEITAWALEIAAWMRHSRGDTLAMVDYAQAGQRVAGEDADVSVQLIAHEARGLARMGRWREVHQALERGHSLLSRRPRPDNPRNHFVVDPDKFDFYAMDCYRVVGDDERATLHANQVLALGRGVNGEDLAPMRMAEARITLGVVATRSDDLEECLHHGRAALAGDRKCLPSLLLAAGEMEREMHNRFGAEAMVREFDAELNGLRRTVRGA